MGMEMPSIVMFLDLPSTMASLGRKCKLLLKKYQSEIRNPPFLDWFKQNTFTPAQTRTQREKQSDRKDRHRIGIMFYHHMLKLLESYAIPKNTPKAIKIGSLWKSYHRQNLM